MMTYKQITIICHISYVLYSAWYSAYRENTQRRKYIGDRHVTNITVTIISSRVKWIGAFISFNIVLVTSAYLDISYILQLTCHADIAGQLENKKWNQIRWLQ